MATDDPKTLARMITHLQKEIQREVQDRLPRKVGVIAVGHFKQNFRDSGFRDGGLTPWQKSQRELRGGKSAQARYKTLTSGRNHLMSSIEFSASPSEVVISNPVPYAAIHNEGGTIKASPRITPQMRKFAWRQVYEIAGASGAKNPSELPREAQMWRGLALTKKTHLNLKIKMPKRQFIGESRELTEKVEKEILTTLNKIKDGISTLPTH